MSCDIILILSTGAEEDYSLANETLLFIPGDSTVQCFNVSIIDDSIFELEREVFTVSLLVFDEVIDVNVTIIDNDGKNLAGNKITMIV